MNRDATRPFRQAGIVLVLALAIFGFSAQPNLHVSAQPIVDLVAHKTGHLVVYGALAIASVTLLEELGLTRPTAVLLGLLLVVGYGATHELHQAFVPGRTPSPLDVTVDLAGGVLALHAFGRWPADVRDLRPS